MTVMKAERRGRNSEKGPPVRWPAEEVEVFKVRFRNTDLIVNFTTASLIHLGTGKYQIIKYVQRYTVFPVS